MDEDWNEGLKVAWQIIEAIKYKIGVELYLDEGLDFDGWVTIRCEERTQEYKTIARTTKKKEKRYIVEVARLIHGGYWEPDDVDVIEVDDYGDMCHAIKEAILLIIGNHIDGIIEGIEYDKFLKMSKEVGDEI